MKGFYTKKQIKEKILRYKLKVQKWKKKFNTNRNFFGRSKVARMKVRVDGKFLSSKMQKPGNNGVGYINGLVSDTEVIKRNKAMDYYFSIGDINKVVDIAVL